MERQNFTLISNPLQKFLKMHQVIGKKVKEILCREGYFILPYNELAIAQGPKIQQKNKL